MRQLFRGCIVLVLFFVACREEPVLFYYHPISVQHVVGTPLEGQGFVTEIPGELLLDLSGTFVISQDEDFVEKHRHPVILKDVHVHLHGDLFSEVVFLENQPAQAVLAADPTDFHCFFATEKAQTAVQTYVLQDQINAYTDQIGAYAVMFNKTISHFAGQTDKERSQSKRAQLQELREKIRRYEKSFWVFSMSYVCKSDFESDIYENYMADLEIYVPKLRLDEYDKQIIAETDFVDLMLSDDISYRVQVKQGQNLVIDVDHKPYFYSDDLQLIVDSPKLQDQGWVQMDHREELIRQHIQQAQALKNRLRKGY
ncbi:MAG: hypothetical protein R3A45_06575 [Bdellovibrionota bacterium]|nr:hypothetical protein [Deltaproteobacteria bacterium]